MEYAFKEGADWRYGLETWIKTQLRHSVFNPNKESKKYLQKTLPGGNFRALKFKDISKFEKIVRRIVEHDSKEIAAKSDYVICYWDESAHKGAGTKGELTLAKFFRKPVYLVTQMKREDIPGWVLGCVSRFFSSFDELKQFLAQHYSKSPQRSP
jgi:hypothetical protein